jgi:hypothetical protein
MAVGLAILCTIICIVMGCTHFLQAQIRPSIIICVVLPVLAFSSTELGGAIWNSTQDSSNPASAKMTEHMVVDFQFFLLYTFMGFYGLLFDYIVERYRPLSASHPENPIPLVQIQ